MKTKFFRVAREGKTIDGREITKDQIDQMAANYDPKTYGARINCEHFRSFRPNGEFPAYGDVLALKAEDDEDGKRVLLAQIDPTKDLIKLSKARQKVYWSIEMTPQFSDTGEAYMTGLAITDSPASLGTEIIKFATENKGALPDHLTSDAIEGAALEEQEDDGKQTDKGPDVFARVKALLTGANRGNDAKFSQLEQSTLAIAEEVASLKTALADKTGTDDLGDLRDQVKKLSSDLAALTENLSSTPASPQRPSTTGGKADVVTDC